MKGVQAWDYGKFHSACRAESAVHVVEFAGFKYVECLACGVLCNLDAIGTKFGSYEAALRTGGAAQPVRQEDGVIQS